VEVVATGRVFRLGLRRLALPLPERTKPDMQRCTDDGMAPLRHARTASEAGAHESPLTPEESEVIDKCANRSPPCLLCYGQLQYSVVENSRYIGVGPDLLPYIKEEGRLDKIPPENVRVAVSGETIATHEGAILRHRDVAIVYPDGGFSITAKCMGVVIEGVPPGAVQSARDANGTQARLVGKDFCHVGLPRTFFGNIFSAPYPFDAVWQTVRMTPRYIWVEASWGTPECPMTFQYMQVACCSALLSRLLGAFTFQG
jgi:hypothetical protein